ncbi:MULTISPECIES: HAD-IA family hydrolase [unclassified Halomonas]|uniref:HAD-IA family hydrolase n=1 Tax=unclassified Halomonas TaxID=2609666 RepID=UPI001C977993|nr:MULTISPECIES: HAD-IA family hydrolase [unclassified Halomonas]MBY5925572.1 HAD-IA family hydrolase [Halomonas sp. DP4Y7-2]MBY6232609.1 HAD-IA family hydrolase [Halomonas sp. DP4Y7-1]
MRYDLTIFDWDGTLMDSIARIVSCMQVAAREVEWGELGAAEVRNIIGLGLPEAIATLCPGISPDHAERLKARYSWHFVEGDSTPVTFYPGVEAGLAELSRQGALAVATGKSRKGLDRIFRQSDTGRFFVGSRTADETRSKPHPQMLEELLAECGVPPERAIMIGDTEYDMEMARAIGMPRMAVSYGVHDVARLERTQPVLIADDFAQVLEHLRG